MSELQPQAEAVAAQYLTTVQAGIYLQLSEQTLRHKRVHGGGPPFVRMGRAVRYRIADLDEWAGKDRKANTSGRAKDEV